MEFELVIKEGMVITGETIQRTDIGIAEGKIAAVDTNLVGHETILAAGKYVIPGGIDPHVHLEMPAGAATSSDDWSSGTQAAAIGGTTTVLDFVEAEQGQRLLEALAERKAIADRGAWIDYGLHMTLADPQPEVLAQAPEVAAAGVPSFKMYTTYDFKLSDEGLIAALDVVSRSGGMSLVHAENDAIVQYMRRTLLAAGKTSPRYHPVSRPAAAEAEAVERVLAMAAVTYTPIYIVHVSTQAGAQAIGRARERGQNVYGETCPQYLVLTDAEYERPDFEPAKFVCSPPLRTAADNEFLWQSLAGGTLQTTGTDHCPFFFAGQKDLGKDRFTLIPGGMPGIESRLILLHTYGVRAGKLDLKEWVRATSENAARIFGLYPRKGAILPGSDADLVIFDPERAGTISVNMLHENVDYTPYEGMPFHGLPVLTLFGGQVIAKEGEFTGKQRTGIFIPRPVAGAIHGS